MVALVPVVTVAPVPSVTSVTISDAGLSTETALPPPPLPPPQALRLRAPTSTAIRGSLNFMGHPRVNKKRDPSVAEHSPLAAALKRLLCSEFVSGLAPSIP